MVWKMRKACGNIPQKSTAACQVRLLLLPICVPSHIFFRNFFTKNFVDSIIIVTFAAEFERTEKNGRDEDSNKRAY